MLGGSLTCLARVRGPRAVIWLVVVWPSCGILASAGTDALWAGTCFETSAKERIGICWCAQPDLAKLLVPPLLSRQVIVIPSNCNSTVCVSLRQTCNYCLCESAPDFFWLGLIRRQSNLVGIDKAAVKLGWD